MRRGLRIAAAALAMLPGVWLYGNAAAAAPGRKPVSRPPNIVIILADDMGFSDPGFMGGRIDTPNLDRLARQGTVLPNFYNEAKCVQTRAALMSGRTHRAVLEAPPAGVVTEGVLAGDVPTIADRLRGAGYTTMISGKWHLGDLPDRWPGARGFDRSFSLITGASSYFQLRMRKQQEDPVLKADFPPRPFMVRDGLRWTPPSDGFYMTDALTDAAIDMMQAHRRSAGAAAKPFFLYLAYTAPHWPLHARDEDIANYHGRFDAGWEAERALRLANLTRRGLVPSSSELAVPPPGVAPWASMSDRAEWARRMEVYAAQLDRMDQGIGRVIAVLERMKVLDETLILFLSDNGASTENVDRFGFNDPGAPIGSRETNTSYREPWAAVSNTPFRDYKRSLYEGGIRTALVARWPGHIPAGRINPAVAHVTDLVATALGAAGLAEAPEIEGRNLMPVLAGRDRAGRRVFWAFRQQRAIRDGQWKLVSADGVRWELYNLARDPAESRDLAKQAPRRAGRLRSAWEHWAESAGRARPGAVARD